MEDRDYESAEHIMNKSVTEAWLQLTLLGRNYGRASRRNQETMPGVTEAEAVGRHLSHAANATVDHAALTELNPNADKENWDNHVRRRVGMKILSTSVVNGPTKFDNRRSSRKNALAADDELEVAIVADSGSAMVGCG